MRTKNKVFIVAGIVLALVMGRVLLKPLFSEKQEGQILFGHVTRGNLEMIVSSTGTLSAVETVEVGAQVSGIVQKLEADYNDQVKKGQCLAVLDQEPFKISVQDAEAGVKRAKAQENHARAEYNRNRPLFEKGHLSEMEFLKVKTQLETTEADVMRAQSALNKARTNLGYTIIRSPINGTIIERTVDAGQTIAATFQAPRLFTIAQDLTRMQIEADVDESDIGLIKKGQPLRFTVQAYPEAVFKGIVRQIRLQPITKQNVVNYTVVADAANPNRQLLPGMTATVDFLVNTRTDVLLIPNEAITFKPAKAFLEKYPAGKITPLHHPSNTVAQHTGTNQKNTLSMEKVYCFDKKGKLRSALLEKGVTDGRHTEIRSTHDLKEGMQVITGYRSAKSKHFGKSILPAPPGSDK